MPKLAKVALGVLVLGGAVWLGLPELLHALGLHPACPPFEGDLSGRSALVIATSHSEMCGESGGRTGVASSELLQPYFEFLDAGMAVDVASIRGGEIPIEPGMLDWPLEDEYARRYKRDAVALEKVRHSLRIDDLDFREYDVVFLAGGWGASWDLGTSRVLGDKITEANHSGALLGAVCHGVLGLIQARDETGAPLLKGRRATGVTDEAVAALGITCTPQHPETELRRVGALFEEDHEGVHELFTNYRTRDGNLFTGMNQNASCATAQDILYALLGD